MKTCDRQSLTLLAAGLLDDIEAQATRAHLDSCPACRAQFAGMQRLCDRLAEPAVKAATLPPPAHFHERLRQRLRDAEKAGSGPSMLALVRAWFARPWLVLAAGACLVALLLASRFLPRRADIPGNALSRRPPISSPAPVEQPELAKTSTALAYQLALSESFEALEALLEQNGRHGTPSATTLLAANRGEGR